MLNCRTVIDADHLSGNRICPVHHAYTGRYIRSIDDRGLSGQYLVRHAPQEQVAALAADICDGRDKLMRQLLLP